MKAARWITAICVLSLLPIAASARLQAVSDNTVPQGGGPYGGNVQALAIDPSSPSTLYTGTAGAGIFKSTNGGKGWTAVNAGLTNKDVLALAVDPSTPSTLYAGTNGEGLFKSVNGGMSWTRVSIQFIGRLGTYSPGKINALAIDPSNPGTLYAGSNTPGPLYLAGKSCCGVFKTMNGGRSWAIVNSGLTNTDGSVNALAVNALAIDPSSPATIYAGTDDGGVFKSANGGADWTAFNSGWTANRWRGVRRGNVDEYQNVNALVIDPSDPSTLYAGTGFEGVFKSTSRGGWTAV